MKRKISLFLALSSALLLFASPAYAVSSDSFGTAEKAALVICGNEITSGGGFLKNTVWLSDEEWNRLAASASGELTYRLGLGDSFSESVTYSTFENHGEPVWQYRCVSGLDLTALAKALGINTDQKMSITVSAPDGMSKTLPDAFSYETKRYSFGTDGRTSTEIGTMLALYESSTETGELGKGRLPTLPIFGAGSPDRVRNTFCYGQTATDEITNCFWVKDVNRLRYGAEAPALTITDAAGKSTSVSLSTLMMNGIWEECFGSVSTVGIPLREVLPLLKISLQNGEALKAVSADGRSMMITDASKVFLAWNAVDHGSRVENKTALRLYSLSGECFADLSSLEISGEHPFADTAGYAWAEEAITSLYRAGIVNGIGAGKFGSGLNIKRGDLILMLDRAFSFPETDDGGFPDVPADAYYAEAISRAKGLGIAKGDGEYFYPENNVTRQEAMALIARTISACGGKLNNSSGTLSEFSDTAEIEDWAYASVELLVGAGIVNGKGGRIAPDELLTRAEMAVIICRTMNAIQ